MRGMHAALVALGALLALSLCACTVGDLTGGGGHDAGARDANACPGATVACGSQCVDPTTDPNHCGSCTTECATPLHGAAACIDAQCKVACDPGYEACGLTCIASPGPACIPSNSCQTGTLQCTNSAFTCRSNGNASAGVPCGAGEVCDGNGQCSSCAQGANCKPSDPCRTGSLDCSSGKPVCQPAGAQPAGTSCGGGEVCSSIGTCGACQQGATCVPSNPCQTGTADCTGATAVCNPNGNAPAGTSCGGGMVCDGHGSCVTCSQGASCDTGNACTTGTTSCASGAPVCQPTASAPAGTSCGSGQVCNGSGVCVSCAQGAPCTPSNPCNSGSISCTSGAPVCQDSGSNIAAGTSCGSGKICDSSGACVSCNQGAACSTGNSCTTGAISCASGSGVCQTSGNAPAGTACGTNQVCNGSGACVACTNGASCTPSNPCHTGTTSCTSGTPICQDSGQSISAGTSCGNGMVCNSSGSCVTCNQGASCNTGNPCTTGTTSCSTGSPVCQASGNAAGGTSCGTNKVCDGSGSCVGPCYQCQSGSSCTLAQQTPNSSGACASGWSLSAPACSACWQCSTSNAYCTSPSCCGNWTSTGVVGGGCTCYGCSGWGSGSDQTSACNEAQTCSHDTDSTCASPNSKCIWPSSPYVALCGYYPNNSCNCYVTCGAGC
jgi:hypothetical protein